MAAHPPIERASHGYVLHLDGVESRYRVTVSDAFLDDEVGRGTSNSAREEWIRAHLPGILSAVTAREMGGFEEEPWGRLLVEEIP
jgi:hypothetical protein